MKETGTGGFQSELVDAAKAEGGHAFKMSNRFLVGVPDLFVKLPIYQSCFIECKREDWPKMPGTALRIALTPKQRAHLRAAQKAGQPAGWVVAFERGRGEFELLAGTDSEAETTTQDHVIQRGIHRARGQPWPIEQIVRRIVHGAS